MLEFEPCKFCYSLARSRSRKMKIINSSILLKSLIKIIFSIILISSWQITCLAQTTENLPPLANVLSNSPSPYLAAHGDDPVAWQEWSPATLERARRENKLLFVSIGYFSCHWCHVMQAESYKNAETAALINKYFIPVKVDRELEVALDAQMIAYAQGLLGAAGWPLNVFITPEGYPLYATLYEQPLRFRLKLDTLGKEWQKDSAGLQAIAKNSALAEESIKRIKPTAQLAEKYRLQLQQDALEQADMLSGGISVARKFPLSPQLAVMLEIEASHHDAKLAEWLRLTLDQMMSGGLHDQLGGGFFRYTTDAGWQRPHFEKMLYDNAQLAVIYLRAARILHNPAYRDIAIQTLDFMLTEMRVNGAMISSISAVDDKGNEGGGYLWTQEQLKTALDENAIKTLRTLWGMDKPSDFEFGYLPVHSSVTNADDSKHLQQIYTKLLQARNARTLPKDTKLLASLNGLALKAFSEAADIAPRFAQAADELRAFLVDNLWQKGELLKGMSNGQTLGQAGLEGYAYVASGLMHYAHFRNKKDAAKIAAQIMLVAWQKFYTAKGFVLEQKSELAKPYYQGVIEDGPLPSPSALLIDASLATADKKLRAKAIDALGFDYTSRNNGLFWNASQVNALNRLFTTKRAVD
jgi:uncharacterized protein YyaL (SSP411 family)